MGFSITMEVFMSKVKERALVPAGGMSGRFPDDLPGPMVIPEYTLDALVDYVQNGRRRGGFIIAVLTNDLFAACGMADDKNLPVLREIVRWLYNVPPSQCYGSKRKMEAWIRMNRLERTRLMNGCPTWEDFLAARVVTP